MTASGDVAAAIDQSRLAQLLADLSRFGARPGGGLDRQSLTDGDFEARRFLVEKARALGAEPLRDAAGNFFFRWAGKTDADPVVTGSHVDSQPAGGTLDGAFGVCAAFEALAVLAATGYRPTRPIEAVIWTNEEGSRFAPGTMGSAAFVRPELLDGFRASTDAAGVTFGAALRELEMRFGDIAVVPLARPFYAFVEAHIEQGPVLEERAVKIGVVRGIQGTRWYEFLVRGQAVHAGTTPLSRKRDALMAAVEVATEVYRLLAAEGDSIRMTIGRMRVEPDSINVVPGEVRFTVDLRHPSTEVLERVEGRLQALARPTARCTVEVVRIMDMPPTQFGPTVVKAVEAAAGRSGLRHLPLDSGAFHDSLRLNGHCPTGMIFVPSEAGVSHSPEERTAMADLAAGARVLAETVLELADV